MTCLQNEQTKAPETVTQHPKHPKAGYLSIELAYVYSWYSKGISLCHWSRAAEP